MNLAMPVPTAKSSRTQQLRRLARQRREKTNRPIESVSSEQCELNRKRFEFALEHMHSDNNSSTLYPGSSLCTFASSQGSMNSLTASSSYTTSKSYPVSLPCINEDGKPNSNSLRSASCSKWSNNTNGPTHTGSLLYIKKASVAHSAKPSSSTKTVYDHERFQTQSTAMQEHIHHVSSKYRVVSASKQKSEPNAPLVSHLNRPDLIFIPASEPHFSEVLPNQHETTGSLKVSGQDTRHNVLGVAGSVVEKQVTAQHSEPHHKPSHTNVPATEERTKSPRQSTDKSLLPESPDVNIPEGPSPAPASSCSPGAASIAKYWTMKTWVDDATVSSHKESEENIQQLAIEQQPEVTNRRSKSARSKEMRKSDVAVKQSLINNVVQQMSIEKPVEGHSLTEAALKDMSEISTISKSPSPMNLKDLKKMQQKLPDFICPHSEEQSREYAVMNWLDTTNKHFKARPLL